MDSGKPDMIVLDLIRAIALSGSAEASQRQRSLPARESAPPRSNLHGTSTSAMQWSLQRLEADVTKRNGSSVLIVVFVLLVIALEIYAISLTW